MSDQNIVNLRDELIQLFHDIKNETVKTNIAAEMNNAAGKIMQSLKVQLEYSALKEEKPEIKFLDDVK